MDDLEFDADIVCADDRPRTWRNLFQGVQSCLTEATDEFSTFPAVEAPDPRWDFRTDQRRWIDLTLGRLQHFRIWAVASTVDLRKSSDQETIIARTSDAALMAVWDELDTQDATLYRLPYYYAELTGVDVGSARVTVREVISRVTARRFTVRQPRL